MTVRTNRGERRPSGPPGPPDPAVGTPEQFVADFFASFTRDVLGEEDVETVHDRYHTEDVVEVVDGNRLDRDRLVAHLRPVRRNLGDFSFDVHEAVRSGNRVAARFTVHGVVRGNPIDTEIAMFGEFTEDGRLRRSHQFTRTLTAAQD
ncbi:nuclear transport factor 2 family protein [Actinopolymorpha singaporensis]|uniref:SnoaL-like domain-containing protein n=1 Tax=Actinopolymorpha singaporensis TaxID=117157 RepID=A0A1H1S5G5_9ACTN|nr:nuclear transport factor 2 family protein [Actinopolymorpha singaporensis]SDS42479.1 SnoaL-like domain-containing protein [Actinopolymorpha singaporensis]